MQSHTYYYVCVVQINEIIIYREHLLPNSRKKRKKNGQMHFTDIPHWIDANRWKLMWLWKQMKFIYIFISIFYIIVNVYECTTRLLFLLNSMISITHLLLFNVPFLFSNLFIEWNMKKKYCTQPPPSPQHQFGSRKLERSTIAFGIWKMCSIECGILYQIETKKRFVRGLILSTILNLVSLESTATHTHIRILR